MDASKVLEKVNKFTNSKPMRILMNGFMGMTAITICGSIFTLLKSLPFDPWLNFLTSSGLGDILSIPISITTDVISLYVVLSMAYHTAKETKHDGFSTSLVALGSFLLLTPFSTTIYNEDYTVATAVEDVIPTSPLGAQGMFLAIIVGVCAALLYNWILDKGWTIKMPDSVPQNVSSMFTSLIPGGIVFIVFLAVRWGMQLTPFGTAQNLIYGLLQAPLSVVGGGLGGTVVYMVVSSVLWMFGIHGSMVAYVGMMPIISLMGNENLAAFAAGTVCPHPEWTIFRMCFLGGSGATLALNLLMCSPLCKSSQYKMLGKITLPTSLFNINEPIIFGTPTVMNPYYVVPFIATPLVNLAICVILYSIGFAMPTGASFNNFMPFAVYGALVYASWKGAVVQILMLVADLFIYLPFFKAADAKLYAEEIENEKKEVDSVGNEEVA